MGRASLPYMPLAPDTRALSRKLVLTLVIGVSAGFSFAYILLTTSGLVRDVSMSFRDNGPGSLLPLLASAGPRAHSEASHRAEDRSVADELARRVRVLCWVMTQPSNHAKKAATVKATWGKRCNKLLFMSSTDDASLPTVKLPVQEGRNHLWAKTKEAFRYVYEHHRHDADWFLKADDDTYVILENLRYMLSNYSTNDPLYFGCRFKPYTKQGYMSGGAGYVLSAAALERLMRRGLPRPLLCRAGDDGAEDVELGKCLERVGVRAVDTRDAYRRGRFFPFEPAAHLLPAARDADYWYWRYQYYPSDEGLDCCSDFAISFHYVSPRHMYVLDYLIYHLRPYGVSYKDELPLLEPRASPEAPTEPSPSGPSSLMGKLSPNYYNIV